MNKKIGTQMQSAWQLSTWCAALLVAVSPSIAAAAVETELSFITGAPGSTAEEAKIVTFDVPGSICKGKLPSCTTVTAVNSKSVLVGSYEDANGATHGYLRRPNGEFTMFNVPGSVCVPFNRSVTSCATPTGIDEQEEITGSYTYDATGLSRGFLRAHDGAITSFDAPGAVKGTIPTAISSEGVVTGYYYDWNFTAHGFIRSRDGSFTTFDSPDAINGTIPSAISREGVVVGHSVDANHTNHGFIRAPNGSVTSFDAPAAVYGTIPSAIGDRGEVVGAYIDSNNDSHGFLRACDGMIISYDVPDSLSTDIAGINPNGAVTGIYDPTAAYPKGFLLPRGGALQTFTPPGAIALFVTAANSADVVVGSYYTKIGTGAQTQILQHGFLWIPQRHTSLASTKGAVIANLEQGTTPPVDSPFNPQDSTSYNDSISTMVCDVRGNSYPLTFFFASSASTGVWDVYVTINGVLVSANPTNTTLTFAATGRLEEPKNGDLPFMYAPPNGVAPLEVTFNFSGTTSYSAAFGVTSITENGCR